MQTLELPPLPPHFSRQSIHAQTQLHERKRHSVPLDQKGIKRRACGGCHVSYLTVPTQLQSILFIHSLLHPPSSISHPPSPTFHLPSSSTQPPLCLFNINKMPTESQVDRKGYLAIARQILERRSEEKMPKLVVAVASFTALQDKDAAWEFVRWAEELHQVSYTDEVRAKIAENEIIVATK
ncbi:hypothetical protein GQ42DRAFT_65214 [Ramicandelaber brevisporus]|nr:hypothetical protein GQ42DRAFT_65214 [Ramicandelaber brevisporus]